MNSIIIITLALLPFVGMSQSESQRIENARFEVTTNNETAFSTQINSQSGPFGMKEFLELEKELLQKEGIFDVKLLNDRKTIRLDHLSYIEIETIKSLIVGYRTEFEIEEKVPYTF